MEKALIREFMRELAVSSAVAETYARDISSKVKLRLVSPPCPQCGGESSKPVQPGEIVQCVYCRNWFSAEDAAGAVAERVTVDVLKDFEKVSEQFVQRVQTIFSIPAWMREGVFVSYNEIFPETYRNIKYEMVSNRHEIVSSGAVKLRIIVDGDSIRYDVDIDTLRRTDEPGEALIFWIKKPMKKKEKGDRILTYHGVGTIIDSLELRTVFGLKDCWVIHTGDYDGWYDKLTGIKLREEHRTDNEILRLIWGGPVHIEEIAATNILQLSRET